MSVGVVARRSMTTVFSDRTSQLFRVIRSTFLGTSGKRILFPSGVSRVFSARARGQVGYVPTALLKGGMTKLG